MPPKTREITIRYKFTGHYLASTYQQDDGVPGPDLPALDLGLPSFQIVCFSGKITISGRPRWTGTQTPPTGQATLKYELTVITGSGLTGSDTGISSGVTLTTPGTPLPATDDMDIDLEGDEITVTFQVEEVATRATDPDWADEFGPEVEYGPKETTDNRRELIVAGSEIVVAGSVAGAEILLHIPIDAGFEPVGDQFFLDMPDAFGNPTWSGYTTVITTVATAYPMQAEINIEAEFDFGGIIAPLTCPLSGSDGNHSVSGGTCGAFAAGSGRTGVNAGPAYRTQASTTTRPTKDYEAFFYLRAGENAYPGSVNIRANRYLGGENELLSVPVDGTVGDSYSQRYWQYNGLFEEITNATLLSTQSNEGQLPGSWPDSATQPASGSIDEFLIAYYAGLDSDWLADNDEEPTDWTLMIQSEVPANVGSLTHEEDFEIDLGVAADWSGTNASVTDAGGYIEIAASGGEGSAELTFDFPGEYSPKHEWQAGMQAVLVLQTDDAGSVFTFSVNDTEQTKEWSDSIGTADSDEAFTFDLRAPHNATVDTDSTQSRYYEEGWYFGVNKAVSVRFSGIPDGTTLRVKSLTLKRLDRSFVHFGLPTGPWLPNGVGSEYLRHVFGESNKVALEVAGQTRVIVSGLMGYPTVENFFDLIADWRPGWSATDASTADTEDKPLMYIGGIHGAYWNGSEWVNTWHTDARTSVPLVLCEAAHAIRWYPYMGEPGGAYGRVTPMRVGKVMRGKVGVVVVDSVNHEGLSGQTVQVTGGASSPETLTTDVNGFARSSARKYGSGTASVNAAEVSFIIHNRGYSWVGFSAEGLAQDFRAVEADSARTWLHIGVGPVIRTYHTLWGTLVFESEAYADVDYWMRLRVDNRHASLLCLGKQGEDTYRIFLSYDGGFTGTEVLSLTATSAQVETDSERGMAILFYENGVEILRAESEDGGATWGSASAVEVEDEPLEGVLWDTEKDPRLSGRSYLLVQMDGNGVVFISDDLGQTLTQVFSAEATSGLLSADSERGIITFEYENGSGVFVVSSENGGEVGTWGSPAAVQYEDEQLEGTLLDCGHDQRINGRQFLAITIEGDTKVFISEDLGASFGLVLS
jgi:hypothetical protein